MIYARTMFWTLIVPLVATLATACSPSSNEESIKALRAKAREHLEQHQSDKALSVYQKIVELHPKDDEANYQLGLLYLSSGKREDLRLGIQALQKTVRLNGSRIDAQLQLSRLYLVLDDFDKARFHADAVLAVEPSHSEGHLLKGMSYVRERRFQNALAEIQQAIDSDPTKLTARLELARTHALMRNFSDAEAVLREAITIDPQAIEPRFALGEVLAAAEKNAEAEQEYLRVLELDRTRSGSYLRLARLSHKQKRLAKAEGYYRRWIEALPHHAEAHIALAQFYRSSGKVREAEASLHRAREVDPSSRVAHEALITFYLETDRLKDASLEIEAFSKNDPPDISGRILKARLLLQQSETDKAIGLLQDLRREAPKLAIVHHYLGKAWLIQRDAPKAVTAFKEARALLPNSSEIRMNLAQAYMAQGSLSLAIKEGEESIALDPQNVVALKLVAEAHLMVGDTRHAQALLKDALVLAPRDPAILFGLGVVARQQKRFGEALSHFEQSLEGAQNSIVTLEEIVKVFVSQGKITQARERVLKQLVANEQDPRFYNLLGRVHMLSKHFTEAHAAFSKAMTFDEKLFQTYINIADLYSRQGKVRQAIKEFEVIVGKSPKSLSALMILGMLYEQQQDMSRAKGKYEEALRVNEQFAPAANNLAWILIDRDSDAERALSYAETARRVLPHDPHIADTLGWIYYRKQMYAKSASLLKEAVDRLPTHPLVLYHYGIAQHANKRPFEAKKALDKFLTLAPDDPHAVDAKKVLAELT